MNYLAHLFKRRSKNVGVHTGVKKKNVKSQFFPVAIFLWELISNLITFIFQKKNQPRDSIWSLCCRKIKFSVSKTSFRLINLIGLNKNHHHRTFIAAYTLALWCNIDTKLYTKGIHWNTYVGPKPETISERQPETENNNPLKCIICKENYFYICAISLACSVCQWTVGGLECILRAYIIWFYGIFP